MSDNDVNVRFGASTDEINSKMQEVSAVFSKTTGDISSAVEKSTSRINEFTRARNAEYAQETERLIEEERKAAEAAYALAHANNTAAESADKAAHATVGQKREMMVMAHEIMSGNFSRVPGSFMVLMERTGGVSGAITSLGAAMLNPIGLAVGLTAGAVGLGIAFAKASKSADELNNALELTGGYAGKTSDQVRASSQSIAEYGHISIGNAKEIELAMVQSGKISAAAFDDVALAVANYSRVSGKTAEESTAYMTKIFSDPSKGARELDDSLHFLTQSDLDYIDALDRSGDSSGAAEYAAKKLNARYGELKDTTSELGKMQIWLSSTFNEVGEKMRVAFNPTDAEKLVKIKRELAQYAADGVSGDASMQKRILEDEAQAAELTQKISASASQAKAQAAKTAADTEEKALNKVAHALAPNITKAQELTTEIDRLLGAMNKPGVDKSSEEYKLYAAAVKNAGVELENLHDPKVKKPHAAKSDMSEWRAELDAKHDAEGAFFTKSLEDDEKFWAAKVSRAQKGSKDYIGAEHELVTIHKQLAIQKYNTVLDELRNEEAATKAGSEERVAIAQRIADKVGEAYGKESAQYINAYRSVITAAKELETERKKQDVMRVESARDAALAEVDIEHEKLVSLKDTGQISAKEEIQAFQVLEDKKYQIAAEAQQKIIDLSSNDATARQKQQDALLKIDQKHAADVVKLNADMSIAVTAEWNKMLTPITMAFDNSIKGMIMGTTTMQKAMANLTQSILGEFLNLGMTMVKNWAAAELAKTTLTQNGTTSRSILEAMGLVKSQAAQQSSSIATVAAKKVEAAGVIPAEAATAAGGAASSVASIPYVGPALAAAAYAETMGMVMGGMAIASSAGGEWQVPGDRLNFVHQNETILPAHIATPLRAMVENGSSGGDTHVHIHATDAQSVRNLLMQNGSVIMDVIKRQARGFNTKGMI